MIRYILIAVLFAACTSPSSNNNATTSKSNIDSLAREYVKLGLFIGQYDPAFIDAYYGPDSLSPKYKTAIFPKDSVLNAITALDASMNTFSNDTAGMNDVRAKWIKANLRAFAGRIQVFTGGNPSFDEEAIELYGVKPPTYTEAHFQTIVNEIDSVLPGAGTIQERVQKLANRFIIPKEKLDTLFKLAINECRSRTRSHITLPAEEKFKLEFVTNQPWSGYNWYKGNYESLIQINTDLNIFIDRAIDVGSHESYPGHHVYNMLLEKNLYNGKGWVEISMYPLFSPQSLIAEGTANYGIDVVFPGSDKNNFAKNVLLPAAGLDTTDIDLYFKCQELKGKLNFVRNEVARRLLDSTMNEATAIQWLEKYGLSNNETAKKSISFIKVNRSYVINYNYGLELVGNYINAELKGSTDPETRWKLFTDLLSSPLLPADLIAKTE